MWYASSAWRQLADQGFAAHHLDVKAVLVGIRVDRDSANAELASNTDDTAGNLTTDC